MTEQHPLTDEIIEEIWETTGPCDPAYFGERHPSPEEMRATADWQLEQCINELNGLLSLFQLSGKINEAERLSLLNVFKKAMRPQQQEDN